jgi:hypothetical protein
VALCGPCKAAFFRNSEEGGESGQIFRQHFVNYIHYRMLISHASKDTTLHSNRSEMWPDLAEAVRN